MSRNGHQGPCDLLAAWNRPEGPAAGSRVPQGATRLRFIHLGLAFFCSFFFFSFVALPRREPVRAREAFGHVFFSTATSELKARSLDRHLTAGYRRELKQMEFRLALAIVLLFVLQRDMATRERTATEIARMLTVI